MAAVGNAPLSSLGATLNEAGIPLIPKIKVEDLEQVSLTVYRCGSGRFLLYSIWACNKVPTRTVVEEP